MTALILISFVRWAMPTLHMNLDGASGIILLVFIMSELL